MKNILIIILALCLSCTNKTAKMDKSTVISISPLQQDNTAPMSEVLTVKKYVPLENNDEKQLLGDINKLITTADKYIILDNVSMKVFVFDRTTGKRIGVIDAMGQGPREYISIWDIAYREKTDEILILSPKKLLVYTSEGAFKKAETIELFAANMAITPTNKPIIYADYSENTVKDKKVKDNLLLLGTDYQLDRTYMPFETMVNSFVRINPLIGNGNSLLYYNKADDKLYGFTENESLNALYTLDYGNDNSAIAATVLSALESDKTMSAHKAVALEKEKKYCSLHNVLHTPSYLFIVYSQNDYFYYAFYNKTNGKLKQFAKKYTANIPPIPLVNDFDEVLYYPLLSSEGNTLVSYALSDELIDSEDRTNEKLEEVRPQLTEDTFVIVEFEIKD